MISFAQEIYRFIKSAMAMVQKVSFPTMLIMPRVDMIITTHVQEPQERIILLRLSAKKAQASEYSTPVSLV